MGRLPPRYNQLPNKLQPRRNLKDNLINTAFHKISSFQQQTSVVTYQIFQYQWILRENTLLCSATHLSSGRIHVATYILSPPPITHLTVCWWLGSWHLLQQPGWKAQPGKWDGVNCISIVPVSIYLTSALCIEYTVCNRELFEQQRKATKPSLFTSSCLHVKETVPL